ncbi:hypothetical protein GDO81_027350 [Engystomops pustulosus]|uniref:Uncharacterized protein n=1 Tax=Engystomops pustulosus TaxID=76066 RepID=A0AAV6YEL3_ENGPU|nr:hypothetical protein GDO81_027350 [Engystomops pustulosus]
MKVLSQMLRVIQVSPVLRDDSAVEVSILFIYTPQFPVRREGHEMAEPEPSAPPDHRAGLQPLLIVLGCCRWFSFHNLIFFCHCIQVTMWIKE